MPQWIFWEENISFVVFGAVYWPFSMVDYTERRKTERKKENVSPLHHRPTTERRNIKRNKNETVFKFYFWSMPQWSFFQTAGPTDFQNVLGISFLPANFTIGEDNFSSITENSLVVLDDFSFKLANNKQAKINFLKVVNYILFIHKLV